LVLTIGNPIGKYHGIGAFFADDPCKVWKRVHAVNPAHLFGEFSGACLSSRALTRRPGRIAVDICPPAILFAEGARFE
jgi:hypothetical protein